MSSFQEYINSSKPVVVDFFAEWCGPCKMMPPILKQVKDKLGDAVTILKMDIDKNPSYARQFQIQAVPTLIIFRKGQIIWRKSGIAPAHEILNQLSSLVV